MFLAQSKLTPQPDRSPLVNMYNQQGQTLIETLVAAFILVMGIVAALGLASYSLSATSNIRQQTIAMGLAREGIEVVKNMRDTNWLRDTRSSNCKDFLSGQNTAFCYKNWLTASNGYDLNPGGQPGSFINHFYLDYNSAATLPWSLVPSNDEFGLNLVVNTQTPSLLYQASRTQATTGNSIFARRITIEADNSFAPFNDSTTGPRLKITSEVWWKAKGCDMTILPVNSKCKVTLSTYLTNWRNF